MAASVGGGLSQQHCLWVNEAGAASPVRSRCCPQPARRGQSESVQRAASRKEELREVRALELLARNRRQRAREGKDDRDEAMEEGGRKTGGYSYDKDVWCDASVLLRMVS